MPLNTHLLSQRDKKCSKKSRTLSYVDEQNKFWLCISQVHVRLLWWDMCVAVSFVMRQHDASTAARFKGFYVLILIFEMSSYDVMIRGILDVPK
jgi:hypothetical protein